jgi:hypothetical protein
MLTKNTAIARGGSSSNVRHIEDPLVPARTFFRISFMPNHAGPGRRPTVAQRDSNGCEFVLLRNWVTSRFGVVRTIFETNTVPIGTPGGQGILASGILQSIGGLLAPNSKERV